MESTLRRSPVPPREAATPGPAGPAEATRALVEALRDPRCFPHPAADIRVHETHISYVVCAGDFAYKLKKPVRLPFLDFSTLDARRRFCEEEVRLNRRTAPQLYLGVVPIGGTASRPRVGLEVPLLDYAVEMRRFADGALFVERARARRLSPETIDALADRVASFHAAAARATAAQPFGTARAVLAPAMANFDEIAALEPPPSAAALLEELRAWTLREHAALAERFERRKAEGFVRECHGDLHLGNVVEVDGEPVPFDCIEFDERFRWIDVMDEVAFTLMDLVHLGLERLGWRYLDRYLQATGDYEGLPLLRFYLVHRAMVRAKIAWIRHAQLRAGGDPVVPPESGSYLALARRLSRRAAPVMVLMQGLSASGKTTASQRLLEALGAVRVRSDVERKRLAGIAALASARAAPGEGLYDRAGNEATYGRLAQAARIVLEAGFPVVVDATFLRREERAGFRRIAQEAGAAFEIASCLAPHDDLRRRVLERGLARRDASDADAAVLEAQIRMHEPLAGEERRHATLVDSTCASDWHGAIESLARRFRSRLE